MARVLVLTDRTPGDTDWKGAFAWSLVRSLAESQHEVLVLTTADTASIDVRHPRLLLGQPAKSWALTHLPKFLQAILLFRPDVVHTFAPRETRSGWSGALTLWPYLNQAFHALPRLRRFATVFDPADLSEKDAALSWLRASERCLAFSESQKRELVSRFALPAVTAPLEVEIPPSTADDEAWSAPYLLVPAAASEWQEPEDALERLAAHLAAHPRLHARVIGGFGDWPASAKRRAWETLMPVAERFELLHAHDFERLLSRIAGSQGVWLDGMAPDSWRFLFSAHVAERLGKPVLGARSTLVGGSTANYLSRLFAQV